MRSFKKNISITSAIGKEHGVSLIIVMIVLAVVSLLGVAGIQISSLGEKSARNDRDLQIAFQSAEAAFLDAEYDIRGPIASTRRSKFGNGLTSFTVDCGKNDNAGRMDPTGAGNSRRSAAYSAAIAWSAIYSSTICAATSSLNCCGGCLQK